MVKAAYDSVKKLPRCLRTEDLPIHTFTPRTYQLELLDAALEQNTIICVNSPAGKTFIAVMLIKEMAVDVRPMPMDFNKRKFTIFIVSSEAQLESQAKVIAHHTDLAVAHYADDEILSTWEKEDWRVELLKRQVLVTTANFLQKLLEREYFSLAYVNLLLIDECSNICSSQAHMEVMKICEKCQHISQPRIVVLTATLLSSKCKDPVELENTITMLETTFHSTAETSTLVFSERHGTSPKEALYDCNNDFDEIQQMPDIAFILQEALLFIDKCVLSEKELENCKDPLQVPRTVLYECLNILDVLGPWCVNHIAEMFIKQVDKLASHEQSDLSKMVLRYTATQLRLVTRIFEKLFNIDYCIDEFMKFVTPKVIKLVNILRSYKPEFEFVILRDEESDGMLDSDDDTMDDMSDSDDCDSSGHQSKDLHITLKHPTARGENSATDPLEQDEEKKLCGLIFVDCKYVAYALNKVIEEVCSWDENLCFVKSSHITGYKNGSKRDSTNFRKHEEVLRRFRMQETNLLVATSNFEEGIDIPKCNLVVCFDPPKDYKSYSQSKARARARNANFLMLVDSEKARPFNTELKTYKRIEQVLLRKYNNQLDPTKEELNEILEKFPIPPFLPLNNNEESTAPPITLFSAISIINRYCAKLPSDAFTYLTPKCSVEQTDFNNHLYYVAALKLPINSPVKKEVKGVPMPIEKLAKMSAALKMCQELQLQGELDDHFLPVGKEILKYEEKEALKDPLKFGEEGEWEEEEEEEMVGCPRPGTTKRKQYYFKKAADALMCCHVEVGKQCQLYNIHMVLTGPITEEQNTRGRKIYVPENTPRGFGILSSKNIPQVPRFPVYTRSGEVTVSVNIVQPDLFITESQMKKLTAFHRFVFSTVLRLEKDPIDFMPEEAKVGYIIVPLIEGEDENLENQINWNFVDEVQESFSRKHPDIYDPKREKFQFCTGDFEDAVVMPSYRNMDQPQHFYVAEIKHDLNPNSPFPSPELYRTFNEYYSKKYGLHITNLDQPLLDVDHTSARLNLLTPRYMNQKGIALPTSSAETKKARRENLQQKQILIPELCVVHIFPASLWRKAVCLPAILYRINYLLIAEEIRVKIAQGTKIGVIDIPKGFQFPKLDFGFETNPEKIIDNRNENEAKSPKPIDDNENSESTETVIATSAGHHHHQDSQKSSAEEEKTLHKAEKKESSFEAEPKISSEKTSKLQKDLKNAKEAENKNMSTEKTNSSKSSTNNIPTLPCSNSSKSSTNNIPTLPCTNSSKSSTNNIPTPPCTKSSKSSTNNIPTLPCSNSSKSSTNDIPTLPCSKSSKTSTNNTPPLTCSKSSKTSTNNIPSLPCSNSSKSSTNNTPSLPCSKSSKTSTNNIPPLPCSKSPVKSPKTTANNNNNPPNVSTDNQETTADDNSSFAKPTKSDKAKESSQEKDFVTLKNLENWAQNSSSVDPPPKEHASFTNPNPNPNPPKEHASFTNPNPNPNPNPPKEHASFTKSKFPNFQGSGKIPEARKEDFKITFDIPRDLGVSNEAPNDFVASDSQSKIQFQNESLMKDLESLDIRLICSNTTTYPKGSTFSAVDEQIRKERQSQSISSWVDKKAGKDKKRSSASVEPLRSSKCKIVELPSDDDSEECQNNNLNGNCDKTKPDSPTPSVAVKNIPLSAPPEAPSTQKYTPHPCSNTIKAQEINANKINLYPAEMNGNICLNGTNSESAARTAAHVTETSAFDNLLRSSENYIDDSGVICLNDDNSESAARTAAHVTEASAPLDNLLPSSINYVDESGVICMNDNSESAARTAAHVTEASAPLDNLLRSSINYNDESGVICMNDNSESAARTAAHVTEASAPLDNLLRSSINYVDDSGVICSAVDPEFHPARTDTQNMPESSSSLSSSLSSSPTSSPSHHLSSPTATASTSSTSSTSSTQHTSPSQGNQDQDHPNSLSQHLSVSSEELVEVSDSDSDSDSNPSSSLETIPHPEDHTNKKMASPISTPPDHKASTIMKLDPPTPSTTNNNNNSSPKNSVQPASSSKETVTSEPGKSIPPSSTTDNNANCDISSTKKRDLSADVFQNVTSFCGEAAQLDTSKISDYGIIADKANANFIYSYASSQEINPASPLPPPPPPPPLPSCPPLLLDTDIELSSFIGPSPCVILQALTMSNANDFFSLERLETIGDSFLKYAITVYLYCQYPGIHEGKLSYLRSKQVSNYNLYRLGRKKGLPERMVSAKFEPYENWLPPGYVINEERRRGPVHKVHISSSNGKFESRSFGSRLNGDVSEGGDYFQKGEVSKSSPDNSFESESKSNDDSLSFIEDFDDNIPSHVRKANLEQWKFNQELEELKQSQEQDGVNGNGNSSNEKPLIPYSLQTIHSIPDKSVADCVEALIGCYLTCCGKRAALLFMSWLGLKVLPQKHILADRNRIEDSVTEHQLEELESPVSPLLTHISNAKEVLEHLLDGYKTFEKEIGYQFRDRSYLLQAFTHASYHYNTVTDCYQRLEFLGDAILDYVITRHLYEDSQRYSPGVLTDLRSALVNNNIFAALAVKWNFHKFFKAISPELFNVIERFVARQKEKEDEIDLEEEEEEEENSGEEVVEMEIPKALGDIFESVAGAIYLDSGMSLDVVWKVYYHIMKPQIDKYLKSIPKSPVRELLEMEPETAKFEKPERTVNGKIRVTVKVAGKGVYHGVGRNYRIAKSAAAKKALRILKTMQAQGLIL